MSATQATVDVLLSKTPLGLSIRDDNDDSDNVEKQLVL